LGAKILFHLLELTKRLFKNDFFVDHHWFLKQQHWRRSVQLLFHCATNALVDYLTKCQQAAGLKWKPRSRWLSAESLRGVIMESQNPSCLKIKCGQP
jgi:hypothetical protein